MRGLKRWSTVVVAGATVAALALTGCSKPASSGDTKPAAGNQTGAPKAAPASLTITPATGAVKVSTRPDVKLASDGKVSEVAVTDAAGKTIAGALAADQLSWHPANQLAYNTKYTVTAKATNKDGTPTTATSAFTTMSAPDKTNGLDFYVESGSKVGVGLPIVFKFTYSVPNASHAAVQKAISISTTQPVAGAWRWFSSDELHFRPQSYWTPGTKIVVRAQIGGVNMGNDRYGKRDRSISLTVGPKQVLEVDNKTHVAKVMQNDKLIRTMKASLGKRSTPSSSGTMVVLNKSQKVTMDSATYGVTKGMPGYYREDVYWDVRYTWSGEFVHGAPWSVDSQGNSNVSHGCVNLSTSNAKFFFNYTQPGDIIHIVNTVHTVDTGDGFTDWQISWDSYLKSGAAYTTQSL
jgi:lipoprotein-anchoring transpeptidase ErfK/SrfK